MNRVIYTALFGKYDELKEPVKLRGWDYVCFTDQNVNSDVWKIRKIPGAGVFTNRNIKINPHLFLPGYDEWLYLDASINIIAPFDINTKVEWLGVKHRTPDPWCEFHRIIQAGKGDAGMIKRQLNDYAEFLEPDLGHMAGGVLYRKNTEAVIKLNESWWAEFKKYPSRDQISLYKVLHETNCNWAYLNDFMNVAKLEFHEHLTVATDRNEHGNIYEFTPSGEGTNFRDYGKVLNRHCEMVPYDEDWIIIRDQDTFYFPDTDYRRIIREASIKYPDTGIFGAYTNRIGLKWQLDEQPANPDTNIMNIHTKARERMKQGSECEVVNKPIAGFFMMFKKGTWKSVKFVEGDMADSDILFDWDFSKKVLSMGLKTRLIKGLYLFHFYRMQKNIKDVSHIFD
jgi:hypothetical protein